MRLISQDGKKDIPYENSAIYVVANYGHSKENGFHNIVGYEIMAHTGDDYWNIGDYSTEEKALKVMSKLREDWKDDSAFFFFPKDEEVESD